MHPTSDPISWLAQLDGKFRTERWPNREEMQELLRLCHHQREAVSETALTLLLHPPVTAEPAYYQHLIQSCLIHVPSIRQLPLGLIEALLEVVVHLQGMPNVAGLDGFFHRLLRSLPKPAVAGLLQKSFALTLFLGQLPPRSVFSMHRQSGPGFKKRWRLLRHALLTRPVEPGWSQPTCATLNLLWQPERACRHYPFRPARWLRIGRLLKLPTASELADMPLYGSRSTPGPRHLHYGAESLQGPFSETTRRFWQTLLDWQAKELLSVQTLAREVSCNTRRVILSWHNASLAAASGWAFPPLRQVFPAASLWREYKQAVSKRIHIVGSAGGKVLAELETLWQIWQQRLVLPKIVQAVWDDRLLSVFHSDRQKRWNKNVLAVSNLLPEPILEEILAGNKYGWPEALSPHQRFPLEQILAWRGERQRLWADGLLRLAALIDEGQRLLDRGDLSHLVLPWIDKFFISSKREADLEYLSGLIQWLTTQTLRPLVLFWDDTARSHAPSLQLALEALRSRGQPVRGIGIFAEDGTQRQNASVIIGREHTSTTLFALRPWDDTHNPQSLEQLLHDPDYGFFRQYDSSWKDNLCQLYVGTQVFPLLAVQSEREALPASIAAGGVKYPFGCCIREYLRDRVVTQACLQRDALDDAYAWWANLG